MLNILKNSLGWMNDTSSSQNNSSQSESEYPHIFFSLARNDHTFLKLLTVFSADFLDLVYEHNVIPSQSPFAAIRVSIPTLNLLVNVVPTLISYNICYCDNCPTLGHTLTSQLRPLVNNQTLTQVYSPSPNHLVAHTVKRLTNRPPKSHHLGSLIKNHKHKKPRNTPKQSLLLPNLQIDLVLVDTPPTLSHNQ